jgi:photoactive yellow protein
MTDGPQALPTFDDPALAQRADALSQAELDRLPFGVLKLDGDGRIVGYNRTEQEIAGVEMGGYLDRSLFTDLAPCMDVPGFRGRFQEGLKRGRLNFEFAFETNADPRARHLQVRMLDAAVPGTYWIFIKRL